MRTFAKIMIILYKYSGTLIFWAIISYIIIHPDRCGTWIGKFAKNVEMVTGK
jgi:hypothetical protein